MWLKLTTYWLATWNLISSLIMRNIIASWTKILKWIVYSFSSGQDVMGNKLIWESCLVSVEMMEKKYDDLNEFIINWLFCVFIAVDLFAHSSNIYSASSSPLLLWVAKAC